MNHLRPHIDDILTEFFSGQLEGKTGLRRKRIEVAHARLRECLEAEGPGVLVTNDLVLLAAEREFHPDDAFIRTMHADDLIYTLGSYVRDPWLSENVTDRRVQLRVADALAGTVLGKRLIDRGDMMCALLDLRAGIDDAYRELKTAPRSDVTLRAEKTRSGR
jgi:hypothetical protein